MKLILAADENWAIGNGGSLLCHIPGDLKFFKEKTLNKVVVMGRATFESLPGKKPLPNRTNIILTSNQNYKIEGAIVVNSKLELLKEIKKYESNDVFVVGGEKVYLELLPMCDTCYITKIISKFKADRYFINIDESNEFENIWESELQVENGIKYRFAEYRRLNG